jgi:hypothetical protein
MSFKRVFLPTQYATKDRLTADMISIGLQFGGKASQPANIEDTIVAASIEGMNGDFRILSMLTEWLDYHIFNVNADRLIQLVLTLDEKVKRYWCAVAQWKISDTRFKKLTKLFKDRFEIFPGTDLQIDRKGGEDERFAKTIFRVAKGSLRIRPKDILTPEALKEIHPIYRARLMIGPTYRADMWAILESEGSEIPAAEVARRAYGSFTTAHRVKHDWQILKAT